MSAAAVNRAISTCFVQVVIMEYEGGATVSFTMVGCTEPVHKRRTKISGTRVSRRLMLDLV